MAIGLGPLRLALWRSLIPGAEHASASSIEAMMRPSYFRDIHRALCMSLNNACERQRSATRWPASPSARSRQDEKRNVGIVVDVIDPVRREPMQMTAEPAHRGLENVAHPVQTHLRRDHHATPQRAASPDVTFTVCTVFI